MVISNVPVVSRQDTGTAKQKTGHFHICITYLTIELQ